MTSTTRRRYLSPLLSATASTATAMFVALTVVVADGRSHELDSNAFELARDVREPWLDHFFRAVTTLGLIVIVGAAVLLASVLLVKRRFRPRAVALVAGAALVWASTDPAHQRRSCTRADRATPRRTPPTPWAGSRSRSRSLP